MASGLSYVSDGLSPQIEINRVVDVARNQTSHLPGCTWLLGRDPEGNQRDEVEEGRRRIKSPTPFLVW